ncbi:putative transcriptional regulator YwtF [Anaerotignum neopropionicum]|uniref:Putative transcriptional regulator YwtF n=1 Tax=Anaerotignum neopropionicum TaxID=36847 RepID=A0A136WBT1_9FIRM|nr:LCP family protein [Anaerotignum neopropionicum]KXL51974.1 putative transcriptional regulator YwtF [Anaerotignum neopropionicum]
MRRKRIDYEYRDRRDEIRVDGEAVRRRQKRDERQMPGKRAVPTEYKNGPARAPQGKRNDRRRRLARKRRIQGVFLVFGIFLLLVGAYGASKAFVAFQKWEGKAEKETFQVSAAAPEKIEDEIINLAILGTDEDGFRADVNMIASFNTTTKSLSLIAVPRDTRVIMTSEMTSFLEGKGRTIPKRNGVYGECKLTELHAYAGEGNRSSFSVKMLEEILGIKMDYYIKVDLSAFRDIVDAIGGVDIEVQDRLYYVDPYQDLYIDLYPGFQHLDGKKAEQLVRFREDYAQRDLKRIQVQQEFMRVFLEKICSTQSILKNMNSLIEVALDKTESNITLTEALKYVKYLKEIDPAKMTAVTIPGEGGAYFDMDEEGTKALIDQLIYGIESAQTEQNMVE